LRALVCLTFCILSCQSRSQGDAPQPAAKASTPAIASAPASSAAAAKAWFQGNWQGSYQAELFRIELPVGGVKEWKKDDGAQGSGAGKLSLVAGPDGNVTGTATGPLGEQSVTGHIDGDRAALSLLPKDAGGFQGVILASQAPEGMNGKLSASTGDSLSVRQASVVLTRTP
jgi:hypothetical protein